MKTLLKHGVLFCSIENSYKGKLLEIDNILIDTGSASTVVSIDSLETLEIQPEPDDIIRTIRGVGGTETVFNRKVDYIQLDGRIINDFEIEIAGMDYGFGRNGILDMNFLNPSGAILNMRNLSVEFETE